ncbi:MAG: T9SS type A sorting domain-containing protein, partial [Bacteroidetes bacterium]|nr:T9SS type A sorting domain-containing protein [Bacteroidota bacterium]
PNPADDLLIVQAELPIQFIQILDISGREVLSLNAPSHISSQRISLDVNTLKPGIYAVRINGNLGLSQRFVKN